MSAVFFVAMAGKTQHPKEEKAMKCKQLGLMIVVAAMAALVSLMLIAASPSTPPGAAYASSNSQVAASLPAVAGITAVQQGPITFPPGDWPWYAQGEISVVPEPPAQGQPTEVCAGVVNADLEQPHTALLEFGIARFGIGLPFTPVGEVEVEVPPGGYARGCIVWVPPQAGRWCVEVLLTQPEATPEVQRSLRNVDVDEPLVPGQPHELVFPVGNPLQGTVDITLGSVAHLDGWGVELSPVRLLAMQPGEIREVSLTVTPPAGVPLPDGEAPIVDVEAFVQGQLIGGFRKLFRPPIPLHRFPDPPYAEREISVDPYPPRAGEPTEICAELYNPTDRPYDVNVQFSWAAFGIGIPFIPIDGPQPVSLPPHSAVKQCISWIPPIGGHFCVQAELLMEGYAPQRSQRNIDVDEPLVPGQPHTLRFPVGNPFQEPVTITLGLIPHLDGWVLELSQDVLPGVAPGEIREVSLTVTPPAGVPLPEGEALIVDVEAFVQRQLIGGFRKLFRPPIPLHRFPDPPYAEREISVDPYPPRAGEPTQICVELRNPTDLPYDVNVQFSWAAFGIGIPFSPIDGPQPVSLPPHSAVKQCITWVPPTGGHFCFQAELLMDGYAPQRSQRNIDVDEPLVPGQPHTLRFPVGNPFQEPVTITLGLIPHLPGWGLELSQDVLPDVGPGQVREVSLTVTPPAGESLPEGETLIVDVEAYVEGQLIGGFRKLIRPPIPLHRFPDPPYAEREISVDPYPPRAGEPTEICVELRNPTDLPHDVWVQFSWADFGIGIPFRSFHGRLVHLPANSVVKQCTTWVPPTAGHFCFQVELLMEGYAPQRSQRNIDVDEPLVPGQPHTLRFPVGNPFQEPVTITLGLIPHLDGWVLELSPDVLPGMAPGEVREVSLTVTPPAGEPLPGEETLIVDVEAYVKGSLIGGFRKLFRPPIPLHRFPDPPYAEREISVDPYPPRASEPTQICVELRNPTDLPYDVNVQFSWAEFGIGIPFTPIDGPQPVSLPAHSLVRLCTVWVPPTGGHFCLQAELLMEGYAAQRSQRNIDVDEPLVPGEPHTLVFPVGNPFQEPVTITLGLIAHLDGWVLELSPDVLQAMAPGEIRDVSLTVTPPAGVPLPEDGTLIVDVEAYVEGQLIGGFRKLFRPPVPIHRPRDPVYAEAEIGVDPYPVIAGQPVQLSVEVHNPTSQDEIVAATFSIAPFGIGLPFNPNDITPNPIHIFVPANGAARGYVLWEPPAWRGKFCVRVELQAEGQLPVWSQRNIDVGEPLRPGEPHELDFPVGTWPHTEPVTVTLGLVNHRPEWQVSLSEDVLPNMQPGRPVTVTLTVIPPADAPLGTGEPIVDVEAYVRGELLGGFRKLDIPPTPIHKPHEKVYAETELSIEPDPPRQGQETRVSAEIQNNGLTPSTVILEFGWAQFGMGIPFTTTGMIPSWRQVEVGASMTATAWVTWTPTHSGPQCVQVRLRDPAQNYEDLVSQRNVGVIEAPPCGETRTYTVTVWNNTDVAATVDIGLITFNVPADWEVSVVPSGTITLGPFSSQVLTVTVKIPCPTTHQAMLARQQLYALQEEAGSVATIDVEGYIGGELVGGIELQFPGGAIQPRYLYLPVIMKNH
jgi:uncharacterized membrane protein